MKRSAHIRRFRTIAWVLMAGLSAASCGGGGGGNGNSPPTVSRPRTPSDFTAIGGPTADSIELSWSTASTATIFNIYWDTDNGDLLGTGNKITATTSPLLVEGLSPDIYYFIITAENSAGVSAPSAGQIARPGIPPQESIIEVVPGNGEVTVQWDPEKYAQDYVLYWQQVGVSGNYSAISGVSSPYTLTGLTNDVWHRFRVAAVGPGGEGSQSNTVEAFPIDPPPGWTIPVHVNQLDNRFGYGEGLGDAAINDNGVAAVVWIKGQGQNTSHTNVLVSRYAAGVWSDQFGLNSEEGGFPAVAVAPNDDVFVAYDNIDKTIWAQHYSAGAWSGQQRIDDGTVAYFRRFPQLASDRDGNILATWIETRVIIDQPPELAVQQVWANRFDSASGLWGTAEMLAESPRTIRSLILDASDTNRAVAVWVQSAAPYDSNLADGGYDARVAYASVFDGVNWGAPTRIGRSDLAGEDTTDEVYVDSNSAGSAVALWTQHRAPGDGTQSTQIDTATFDPASGSWSPPTSIYDDPLRSGFPRAAIGQAGPVLASWGLGNRTGIYGSWYDSAGGSWASPDYLAISEIGDPIADCGIGLDPVHGTMLVFMTGSLYGYLYVQTAPAGSSAWQPATILSSEAGSHLRFAMSPNGHAIAVTDSDVTYSDRIAYGIFVSLFQP